MFVAKSGPSGSRLSIELTPEVERRPFGSDKPGLCNKVLTPVEVIDLVGDLESGDHAISYDAICELINNKESEKDPKANPKIVDLLMNMVVDDKTTPTARCYAALILGHKGDVRAIKSLTLALQSNDSELYQYCASALSHLLLDRETNLGDVNNVISELNKGLSSNEEDIDKAAAIVLGELGREEALEPLLDYMTGRDDNMRSCARNLLVNFRSEKTTKLLVNILQSENESPEAKMGAIFVLGEFDRELTNPYSVEDLLIKYLKDDKENKGIRLYSAEALGKMWSKKAANPLIESLKLKDQAFSRFAVEALGRIRDPKAITYMGKLLENNDPEFSISDICDSHEVAWYAACVLENIQHPDVIDILGHALLNEDPVIRFYALEKLNSIGLREVTDVQIDPIISCLSNKEPQIKIETIKLLGKIGNPYAVAPLIKCLDDDRPEIRALTAEALGKIGHPRAIELLVNCLDTDGNQQVCFHAIFALSKIEDSSIPNHLILSMLKNNDSEIRALILKVLMNMMGKNIVPPLLIGLCSDDEFISSRSQEAISQLHPLLLRLGLIDCTKEPYDETIKEKAKLLLANLS